MERAGTLPSTAPASTMQRVAGVLLGRFQLADGRPAREQWEVADMLAHFEPGTVPLLNRHGGLPAGYLDALWAEGRDLHWTGTILPYPDVVEQLRRGAPISLESTYRGTAAGATLAAEGVAPRIYFRGTLCDGVNLVGIALEPSPAAAGSIAWLVDGE